MTDIRARKSLLAGDLTAPPSKSHTMRAILFASLAKDESTISNVLDSPDVHAMINACQSLGASITQQKNTLHIQGFNGKPKTPDNIIDAGNSGQVLRFVAAISSLCSNHTVITGDHSCRTNRPVKPLLQGLSQLGVFATSTKGDDHAPIIIKGPLQPGVAELNGEDSQPVSALLMAAAFSSGETIINVTNPGEKPWVGLTLSWFDRLGIAYENHNYKTYKIAGNANIDGFEYSVPGDFSSIAFPIAAAIVTNSRLQINNVDMNDVQGDKKLIDALSRMGASIVQDNHSLIINKDHQLHGIDIDINDFIDSITILAVIACFASGTTRIRGASIARKKECNRLEAITCELKKMGAIIEETEDVLIIEGTTLHAATLNTYQDHRMAMSLIIASLGVEEPSAIQNIDCIQKSYPNFIEDMKKLGANLEVME